MMLITRPKGDINMPQDKQKYVYVIESNLSKQPDLLNLPPVLGVFETKAEARAQLDIQRRLINRHPYARTNQINDNISVETQGWLGWDEVGYVRIVRLPLR